MSVYVEDQHPRATDGRFTTKPVDEAAGAYGALSAGPTWEQTKVEAERILDEPAYLGGLSGALGAQAKARVHDLMPHMDDQLFDSSWEEMARAHDWAVTFEKSPDAALDEDPVGNSMVDMEDYAAWNEADRAGEDGSAGYDYECMAEDLAERWRDHRDRLIGAMAGADAEAKSKRAAARAESVA